jgi:ribosome-binding factor A
MPAEPKTRPKRVGEGLRQELATLLGAEVRDPGAAGAVVTRVEVSDDLRIGRVMVRLLEGGDDPRRRRDLLAALRRAGGMLRREAARRLALRYAPELRFVYDDGLDARSRIEALLAEVEAERKNQKK